MLLIEIEGAALVDKKVEIQRKVLSTLANADKEGDSGTQVEHCQDDLATHRS